jgi:hypothetical protein
VASAFCPPYEEEVFSLRPQVGQLCPRVPRASETEVASLRFLLKTREYCLSEHSNQVVELMVEVETKDHQIALRDHQLE